MYEILSEYIYHLTNRVKIFAVRGVLRRTFRTFLLFISTGPLSLAFIIHLITTLRKNLQAISRAFSLVTNIFNAGQMKIVI